LSSPALAMLRSRLAPSYELMASVLFTYYMGPLTPTARFALAG